MLKQTRRISFRISSVLYKEYLLGSTWEMILVDPPRTPMRMFWLCGTFS